MRPVSLTVATILLLVASAVALGVAMLSSHVPQEMRAAGPLALVIAAGFSTVCAIGFWRMKRWAVILYAIAALAQMAIAGFTVMTQLPLLIAVMGAMSWSELS
ncbi:MAG: hypothetical protein U0166_03495 [Acidobacteriota bacterium]